MAQLSERFCLNLTDTLSGNVKFLANLFQCSRTTIIQTKPQAQNLLLPLCQRAQNLNELFPEQRKGCRFRRYRNVVVLNEVTQMAVFLFADGSFQRYRLLRNL